MSRTEHIFYDLGQSLDVDALRIIERPKPDIFLCGGADTTSARHLFMKFAKKEHDFSSRVVLAEEVITSWFRPDSYSNLLELEEDLASIASIIPIFLESPGSFAEIGSFASNKELAKKVLVLQNEEFSRNESFINLGPLHKIRTTNGDDSVLCYSYKNIDEYFSDIKDNIIERLRVKEKKFYSSKLGDISILIIELLRIAQLAKKQDIKLALSEANINVADGQYNKIFYLLERMNCIIKRQVGKNIYYTAQVEEKLLRFSFKKNSPTSDLNEWSFLVSQYYSANDKNWIKLWNSIFAVGGLK